MKKLLIVLFISMIVSLYGEMWMHGDFEDGTTDGCILVDNDGDGQGWEVTSDYHYAGAYAAMSVSSGLTPDNVIISPKTWCELDSKLSMMVGASDPVNYSEHFEILLSFTNTDSASFVSVYEETLTSSDWKEIELDLKPYILAWDEFAWCADVYVAVRHYNSDGQSALLIDDVKLFYVPSFYYGEPPMVILPQGVVQPFSSLSFQWDIWDNSGLQNVNLHYILKDETGDQPEATIPMVINPDPEYSWTYITEEPFPGQAMGTFIEYWAEATDMSGYDIVGVSEHFTVEWGEITFTEGFDEDVVPDGWTRFHTGTSPNLWAYDWETWLTANVYSGANSITSASQNNTGPCETENYLVTPRLRVDGDAKLKYFVNAETPEGQSESYIVLINNVGGDSISVVDFSDTLLTETIVAGPDDNVWNERVIDLKPWSGQFLWIAIKHLYTPYDGKLNRYLNIDEFSVAELPKLEVVSPGNAAIPGEDVIINASASDYSGINNLTIYYTVEGEAESYAVMTDNLDGTFTGAIPGQTENTKCSWYVVATDDSPDHNKTSSDSDDIIWFLEGVLEWGSTGTGYTDWPEPINAGDKVAMDWNFGTKANLYLNKIEVGWEYAADDVSWRLVEFDETPTENIFTDLQGVHSFLADGDTLHIEDGKKTPIYGHVALVFETPSYNEIMLDESGDKSHAWQWNSVTNWSTNLWGAFYIKMYVSQTPNGIGDEFVSSTTELCQNYPNPFNPVTSISFYNRISGNVELSVYNTLGEKVVTLVDGKLNEGFNKIEFDASRFNSGVYYYTLRTPEKTLTKKMVLIK